LGSTPAARNAKSSAEPDAIREPLMEDYLHLASPASLRTCCRRR
jgi:hypothetical protein